MSLSQSIFRRLGVAIVASTAATASFAVQASAADKVMVILDASLSMNQVLDNRRTQSDTRFEAATNALRGAWRDMAANATEVGLIMLGHKFPTSCGHVETLIRPEAATRGGFRRATRNLAPLGKAPLGLAMRQAAYEMAFDSASSDVIVITDGRGICNPGSSSSSADKIAKIYSDASRGEGHSFTVHVLHVGGGRVNRSMLRSLASDTGGRYRSVETQSDLKAELDDMLRLTSNTTTTFPTPPAKMPKILSDGTIVLSPGTYTIQVN